MFKNILLNSSCSFLGAQFADDKLSHHLDGLLSGVELLGCWPLCLLLFLLDNLKDGRLLFVNDLTSELLLVAELLFQGVGLGLKAAFGLCPLPDQLVLLCILLGIINHLLGLFVTQPIIVISYGDLFLIIGALCLWQRYLEN